MFGLSLTKILFTLAVIVAIWYGFKWLGRVQAQREKTARLSRKAEHDAERAAATRARADAVEDMVVCSVCKSYVAAEGARSCGRADCPFPE